MKVLICGSRDWTEQDPIARTLLHLLVTTQGELEIVVGTRRNEWKKERGLPQVGVDQITHDLVLEAGIKHTLVEADWDLLGRRAGPIRNRKMLDLHPDLVIAFWDRKSRGTKDTLDEAVRRGIKIKIIPAQVRPADYLVWMDGLGSVGAAAS